MTDASASEIMIRQRFSALGRTLPDARSGEVEAIHKARIATRRLREALPLVASGSRGRRLEKFARGLTRALGSVRELDVALLTLDEMQADGEVPRAPIALLRRVIGKERRRLCVDMARRIERCDLHKLRRKALAAPRRHRPKGQRGRTGVSDPKRLASAEARAARRAMGLRAAIENAGGIYLPDRLHQVRIAVKKLRYAMEITRELRGSRATARIRTLSGVQDLLGRIHDLEVLIMRIRALQGSEQAPDLKLSADLDRLVRRLETECRQLHARYMAFKRMLLDLCDHVRVVAAEGRDAPAA